MNRSGGGCIRQRGRRSGSQAFRRSGLLLLGASVVALLMTSLAGAPQRTPGLRKVREIETGPLGIRGQAGLAFLEKGNRFLVLGDGAMAAIGHRGGDAGSRTSAASVRNPVNVAFDSQTGRLLILDAEARRLSVIRADGDNDVAPETLSTVDITHLALTDPQGITADREGRLYILDGTPPRIVQAGMLGDQGVVLQSIRPLTPDIGSGFRGIAFDPGSGHLFVMEPGARTLLELTTAGKLVAARDLSGLLSGRPQGLTFAPSGDSTDDPSELSLYVLEAGGTAQITELSLKPLAAPNAAAPTVFPELVQVIPMYQFSPPSPDPCGITYYPPLNCYLVTDSEVEEMGLFAGANLFKMSPTGALLGTANLTSFTREPTGIVYNPANGRLFISDDDAVRINILNPGPDGLPFTADDVVTRYPLAATGSGDPEDVALDTWRGILYWVDGVNSEVYKDDPGPNGVFDGVPPTGDDLVTSFDTTVLGVTDPEGICFNTDNGHLFIIGVQPSVIAEVDTDGNLLRTINASATQAVKPASLAYGPSTLRPGTMSLFMTARGVDNNEVSSENDGMAYELSFAQLGAANDVAVTGVTAPTTVTMGTAQTVTVAVANQGTVAETFQVSLADSLGSTVGSPQTVTALAAGATQALSFAWTPTVAGTHTLTATAATVSGETDTVDNVGTAAAVVSVATTHDVAVTGVTAPTPVTMGTAQTVTVAVANQGTVAETFQVSLSDSLGATVGSPQTVTALAAGATQALSFAWTPTVVGTHTLTATAATVSGETDTADNVGTATSVVNAVTLHDVAVTGITAPTPVTVGTAQTATIIVANQGTAAETFQVSLADSLGATVGSPQTVTALSAGATQTLSFAWTPTVVGTHTLTATAATVSGETDTADNVGTAASVVGSGAGTTIPLDIRITDIKDDAEEKPSGIVDRGSSDLELVDDNGLQTVGMRFNRVSIPNGATIVSAYIQFKVDTASTVATALNIQGQAVDNAPGFLVSSLNISSRARTVATVPWSPAAWTTIGAAGTAQRTTDIAPIIQEIVVRPGWVTGNSVVLIITGTGKRVAVSCNGEAAGAPLLHVDYTMSTVPTHDVAVTGMMAPTPVTTGTAQTATVTVANQGTAAETFQVSLTDSLGATVGPPQTVTALAAGATQALSFAWTPTVAGTHTLTGTAATVSGETDTADNVGTAASLVNAVTLHDVAVSGVAAPTPVTMGIAQTVTVNVANQGTAAETFQVSLTDSLGATVGSPQTVTALAAGATQALSFAWTPTVVGTHTLTATAATVSGETDAADNVGTATSVVNAVTLHDVAVSGVAAPTPVTMGIAQTVTVNVANQGTAAETFQVSLADSLGATVGSPQTVTALAAGATQALSFAWMPTVAGTHVLTGTAATVSGETDTVDNVGTATSVVSSGTGTTTALNIRVVASSDDAEEAASGVVDRGSSDLELVTDDSIQTVGLRFNGVSIPRGATIVSAYIQFKVDETSTEATTLNIQGQAVDNAPVFLVSSLNISSRPRTAATVAWSPAAWTTIGAAGTAQRTTDLAPVIQEIVGRSGWVAGNSVVLIITGTGKRVAVAFNGEAAGAPLLHIEYTLPPTP